jgi:hypothetical protein
MLGCPADLGGNHRQGLLAEVASVDFSKPSLALEEPIGNCEFVIFRDIV